MHKGDFCMKRILITGLILLNAMPALGAGFAQVGTFAYTWEELFTGTRQTSLGQADLAGAYGPSAVLLNAAPLPEGDGVTGEYGANAYILDTEMTAWGGAVEWRGWRAGYLRNDFNMDPQLVRTAYNPEGTGETFEAGDDVTLISLGYDLGRLLNDDGPLQWTLGAVYRDYHSWLAASEINASTWDVGSSAGWTTQHSQGWARMSGALSWQNITAEEIDYDERQSFLPRAVRAGVTLESTFGQANWGTEMLRVLLAFSHRFNPEDFRGRDTDHFGFEVTGAGMLVARMGYNSRYDKSFNSWGLGLILAQDFMGPFTVSADYGTYDMNFGEQEMWSVRARWSF